MVSTKRPRGSILTTRLCRVALLSIVVSLLLPAISATQAQTFTVLYSFKGAPDGEYPYAGLTRDACGNLYGTTESGGAYGYGTVFKVNKHGKETVLYSFAGGSDGEYPEGGVVRDAQGNLYGTTNGGGNPDCDGGYGCGTVFKVDKHGKESVLYRFGTMPDGNYPKYEILLLDDSGNLYGTTVDGGDNNCDPGWGCGIVFKLDKNGRETILHTFTGIEELDGAAPYAGLVSDGMGNLYGTTVFGGAPGCSNGGSEGCGTVFKLDKAGKETVLHRFSTWVGGLGPSYPVIRDTAGNLYDVTGGGVNYNGLVFKLNKREQEVVLYNFSYDEGYPSTGVLRDAKGNFYGATVEGNSYEGMMYKLDKSGQLTVLHDFTGYSDGGFPEGTPIMDEHGNLYSTARNGGDSGCYSGCGVVFKISP